MKIYAETELTTNELEQTVGGVITPTRSPELTYGGGSWGTSGIYPGWGNQGMSPTSSGFGWLMQIAPAFSRKRK